MMRLDRFLSEAGVGSRKDLRAMIKRGRVTVDGAPASGPEQKITESQSVAVDGREVRLPGRVVLMLHKPEGFVTSTADPRDRTVMELLPAEYRKLFPVGRLDKDSEGLLILTSDGDFCHRVISPKSGVEKEYYIEVAHPFPEGAETLFAAGAVLEDAAADAYAAILLQEALKSGEPVYCNFS